MRHEPSSINSARLMSLQDRIVTHQMKEVEGWLETCHYYILNNHHLFGSRGMLRKKSA